MSAPVSEDLVSIASLAGRVLLGAVFLQASVQKLRHFGELRGVVANYRLLPDWLVPPFSSALPCVELALTAALWFGSGATEALCAGAVLLVFSVAIGINLARSRAQIDCGCFQSSLRQPLSGRLLVRNAALLLIAVAVAAAGDTTAVRLPVGILATTLGGVCSSSTWP